MSLGIEQPPTEVEDNFKAYLNRMFTNIEIAFNNNALIQPQDRLPLRPQVGRLYYFSQNGPGTTDEGLYIYKSTGWVSLG